MFKPFPSSLNIGTTYLIRKYTRLYLRWNGVKANLKLIIIGDPVLLIYLTYTWHFLPFLLFTVKNFQNVSWDVRGGHLRLATQEVDTLFTGLCFNKDISAHTFMHISRGFNNFFHNYILSAPLSYAGKFNSIQRLFLSSGLISTMTGADCVTQCPD